MLNDLLDRFTLELPKQPCDTSAAAANPNEYAQSAHEDKEHGKGDEEERVRSLSKVSDQPPKTKDDGYADGEKNGPLPSGLSARPPEAQRVYGLAVGTGHCPVSLAV